MYFATRKFWTDLAERGASTVAQAALAVVTASAFGVLTIDSWVTVGAVSLTAGVVAVLKAFALGRNGEDPEGDV